MAAYALRAEAMEDGLPSDEDADTEDSRPLLAVDWTSHLVERVARSRRAARTWSTLAVLGLLAFCALHAARAGSSSAASWASPVSRGGAVALAELHHQPGEREAEGHDDQFGSELALVVGNVSSDGHPKRLSASEGELVALLARKSSAPAGWSRVRRSNESGYLPTASLVTKSASVLAGYSPQGSDTWKELEVHAGDKVWVIEGSGNWTYVAKPLGDKGLRRGYVPSWTLTLSGSELHV